MNFLLAEEDMQLETHAVWCCHTVSIFWFSLRYCPCSIQTDLLGRTSPDTYTRHHATPCNIQANNTGF